MIFFVHRHTIMDRGCWVSDVICVAYNSATLAADLAFIMSSTLLEFILNLLLFGGGPIWSVHFSTVL